MVEEATRREPPTLGKQLVKFVTCGCESTGTIFCNLPSLAWTHAVLVIGLYELLGIPTTYLIEPNGPLKCDLLFGFHELNTSIVKYYII
jgi:hypothetical protein